MGRIKTNVKWEIVWDYDFYDMWLVKPVGDNDFNSPRRFHFVFEKDALKFLELISKSHCAVPNK